jgi:uncharacterized membrane protein YebE (DUF533 family)
MTEQAEKHAKCLADSEAKKAAIALLDAKIAAAKAAIGVDETARAKAEQELNHLQHVADDANNILEKMYQSPLSSSNFPFSSLL